mmetsp:Transcript_13089/g.47770  ORF Transcript_13089/g.47770 Transcript_13089/m.47770 type:complete len:515 (+) Transcript_13089:1092-2636(+)
MSPTRQQKIPIRRGSDKVTAPCPYTFWTHICGPVISTLARRATCACTILKPPTRTLHRTSAPTCQRWASGWWTPGACWRCTGGRGCAHGSTRMLSWWGSTTFPTSASHMPPFASSRSFNRQATISRQSSSNTATKPRRRLQPQPSWSPHPRVPAHLIFREGTLQPLATLLDSSALHDGVPAASNVLGTRALQRAVRVQDGVNLLFFFHVHKAGGTSICQLAKENMRTSTSHECLPDMNAGYLNQVADRAGTNGTNGLHYCFLAHASPELLLSLREDVYPLEMIASESALPDRFPYSRAHISWMTQLREPLARTVSAYHWWMHERDIPKGRIYVNEAGEYWKRGDCHLYEQRANASLVEWLEAYPDNFMTRAFCGGSVMYDVPHLQLNESHLECAKRRLATFAPILILERPERLQLMQESLGWRTRDVWQNAMLTPGGSDPRQTKPGDVESSSALASLTEEELKMLRRTHQLDMRLYKYATDLFEQQLEFYGIPLAPTAAAVDTNDTTSCAGEAA